MRYAVSLPAFAEWSDPRTVMDIAVEAEAAGWDAYFLWDHVSWNPAWGGTPPMADPWLCLAAAATVTSRVLLGPMVTPLPGGRAVLGVGSGEEFEYASFGESVAARGARLDEALTVLTGFLSAEPVDFDGVHFTVHSPPLLPGPVNGPERHDRCRHGEHRHRHVGRRWRHLVVGGVAPVERRGGIDARPHSRRTTR